MEPQQPEHTPTTDEPVDESVELVSRIGKTTDHPASNPVFVVDDTFFRSRAPKSTHWSVAWADLMMTMFILFLTLFVYQLAHREFLGKDSPEVIAGATIPVAKYPSPALPFHPINPTISDTRPLQVRKVVPSAIPQKKSVNRTVKEKNIAEQDIDAVFEGTKRQQITTTGKSNRKKKTADTKKVDHHSMKQGLIPATDNTDKSNQNVNTSRLKDKKPQKLPRNTARADAIITRMYDLSKITVADEKLEKFASVELIPDKTMRIVLTGDLLFPSGRAELTKEAKKSLRKLIPIIRRTPYMINVIGHTDSMPMHSERFSSNWDLSTARAGRVARFLIEQGHIPASHFVVTGYSYYRPVKPNTTAANRRANRRVEIIISKEPPPAQTATQQNIK